MNIDEVVRRQKMRVVSSHRQVTLWVKIVNRLLICTAILFAGNVIADTTIVFKQLGGSQKTIPLQVSNGKVRIELSGESFVLFDSAKKTITKVDSKQSSYVVIDEVSLNVMASTMKNLKNNFMAQMQNLSPENKTQMQMMMGKMVGASEEAIKIEKSLKFTRTGTNKKIAGYHCDVIEGVNQGVKVSEICVVQRDKTNISHGDFESLKQFFDFMKNITSKFPGGEKMKKAFEFWESDLDVVPIQMKQYESGKVKSTYQIDKISNATLNVTEFNVPKEYQKRNVVPGMK